jgi:hypothetical protein
MSCDRGRIAARVSPNVSQGLGNSPQRVSNAPAHNNDAAGFFACCVIFTDYTARIGTYQQV